METVLRDFFLVVPIHFEQWAKKELLEKALFVTDVVEEKGGVSFKAPLNIGCELNYHLKIPVKILLRIDSFKARDFPKLYNSVLKLPWRQYLRSEIPQMHVTCHQSRLMNTTRIAEVAIDAFKRINVMFPPKKRNSENQAITQEVYFRFQDDICQVSIDTSGERLHKRSYREYSGHAPIRENLAAGLIYYSIHKMKIKPDTIFDPMCGTGTFLAEAKTFYQPNLSRGFHFEDFPSYQKSLIKLEYPDLMPFNTFIGSDNDQKVIEQNQKQLKEFEIDLTIADAFHCQIPTANVMTIINPPYGKRVKIEGSQKVFFDDLLTQLLEKNSPLALGILVPQAIPLRGFKNYREENLNFKNGGLEIKFKLYLKI
ncbi:MAG: THUMP domain-containing class I SAM-dependent RNA methyltransferase [Bacteriovoracaceae bacterium]